MKIKRERAFTYLFMFLLLGIIILGLYFVNVKLTGQVTLVPEYTNQIACEEANYTWENLTEQNCTNVTVYVNETIDCEPCLEYEIINETTNETGNCINWTSCINETSTIEEDCVDVVTGGQCVRDVCDPTHLDLCDEDNCSSAGGHWYDGICNAEQEPECSSNSDCASGYECNSNGVCVEETTDGEDEGNATDETIEIPQVVQNNFILSAGEIQPVSISQAGSKEIKWLVTNAGTSVLSECQVNNLVEDSRISFSDESFNLNPGEQREFAFDVTIPEETEEGTYTLRVFLKCYETFAMKDFNVNVFKKEIEFELIDAQRIRKDKVRIFYNLEELSGNDQDVEIGFFLLNQDDQKVSEIKENKTLSANSVKEFRTTMEINESLMPVDESTNESIESNLTLIIDLNSEIYSSSVQERITLGAPIGGFAVFEGVGTGGLIAIIVILVSGVAFFIVRKIRKNKTR